MSEARSYQKPATGSSTVNAIPSLSGNWASVAQVSALAYTMGQSMLVIELDNYLQGLSYKQMQAMLEQEGRASAALGNALRNAGNNQANSTRDQALGQMVNGGIQIAAEVGGMAYSAVQMKSAKLADLNAKLENAKNWEKALRAPPAGALLEGDQEMDNLAKLEPEEEVDRKARLAALEQADVKGKVPQTLADEVEFAKATREGKQVVKGLQKQARTEVEQLQKEIDSVQGSIERVSQKITAFGSALAALGSGTAQMFASSQQTNQAEQELLKQMFQYIYESIRRANDAAAQNASMLGQKMTSDVQVLLAGIARSNEVRG